jgi:hypothetical protein
MIEVKKFRDIQFLHNEIENIMFMALKNDFNVYIQESTIVPFNTEKLSYFFFNKDNRWGYIQTSPFFSHEYDLSTHYTACRERGDGRRIFTRKILVNCEDLEKVLKECVYDYITYKVKPYDIEKHVGLKPIKVEL